jgi:hypothetical protein
MSDKLTQLTKLMEDGLFHHATYRDLNSIWEGLYIYPKADGAFGAPCIVFHKDDPQLQQAHQVVKHTGVSVGAFGRG